MSASQEPRDGDFVAYIDALQRESAARIHAKAQQPMVETMPGGQGPATPRATGGPTVAEPVLNRQQAEELLRRLARSGRSPQAASAAAALAIGLVLLLFWFVTNSGAVPLLLGIGLIAWAVSRLRRLGRGNAETGQQERAQIAPLFGKKPRA